MTMENLLFITVATIENFTPYLSACRVLKLSYSENSPSEIADLVYAKMVEEIPCLEDNWAPYLEIHVSGTASDSELSSICSSLQKKDVRDRWCVNQY